MIQKTPDRNQPRKKLVNDSIKIGESLAAAYRQTVIDLVVSGASQSEIYRELTRLQLELLPIFAGAIYETQLITWLDAFGTNYHRLPRWFRDQIAEGRLGGADRPPDRPLIRSLFPDDEPGPRFTIIENAAKSLMDRRVLSRDKFDQLSHSAKASAFTIGGGLSEDSIEETRNILDELITEGPTLREFERQVSDRIGESVMSPAKVELVYRQTIHSAYRDGRESLFQDPVIDEVFPYQAYQPIRDARARKTHLSLATLGIDGTNIYRRDDPFWDYFTPPWDFNCILPGSLIGGRIELLARMNYSGEAVEIVTKSGKLLRVTINHPILTPQGFVRANDLAEGGYVISQPTEDDRGGSSDNSIFGSGASATSAPENAGGSPPGMDEYYVPTEIDKIFSSLLLSQELLIRPLRPDDFYGDGEFSKGNVDIVFADSMLGNNIYPGLNQGDGKLRLPFSDSFGLADSSLVHGGFGVLSPPASHPRSATLTNNRFPVRFNAGPLRFLCFGSASQSNASKPQVSVNNTPANAVNFGECFDGFSRGVFADEIVNIRKINWCGHVYDAQTPGGWFSSDGVIVSNCRCSATALTIEQAARRGVKEAQEWIATGRKPELVSRLPHIPFPPVKGFGQRSGVLSA